MSGASKVLTALSSYPGRMALEGPGQQLTYDALLESIASARRLLQGAGTVALMMENCPAWVVLDLACISDSVPLLPLPPFFSDRQIAFALTDSGADTIFTDRPDRFDGDPETVLVAGQYLHRIRLKPAPGKLPVPAAKITYTSGTTDEPKGVCLSQEAMETVAASLLSVIGSPPAARHVCLLPLGVLLENVAGVYTALLAGACIGLPPVRHEPQALHSAIRNHRATSCILVPELLRMLLAIEEPLPTLSYAAVGGARVSPELLQAAVQRGIPVFEGYGLSEASSVVTINAPQANKIGSVGKALPHIGLRVDGNGEILLQLALFSGYLGERRPQDAWFATGDIGRLDDDGFLYIEGRKKNMYITSFGRNVSPEWIESLLTAQPPIAQAAVFGEGQPYSVAVIVAHQPQAAAAAIQHINRQLPDYARIGAHIIAEAPFTPANGQLTGNGRPRRREIYAAYAGDIQASYTRKTAI